MGPPAPDPEGEDGDETLLESITGHGARAVAAETARRALRRISYEMFALTATRDLTEAELVSFTQQFHQIVAAADGSALRARSALAGPLQENRQ